MQLINSKKVAILLGWHNNNGVNPTTIKNIVFVAQANT